MSTEQRRIAVVTGAAGALGSAVTTTLASQGYGVAALDLARSREKLEELAARCNGAIPLAADITDRKKFSEVLERVQRELGSPDAAVLTAGGYGGAAFDSAESDSVWEQMLELNLESARVALSALLPLFRARSSGSVVVVGSRVVERPWEGGGTSAYVASKAALAALCQALAAEMRSHGVRINAVLPSIMDTPRNRADMPKADPSAWVSPASLADVIAFLLSDAARDVTGALVPVYGRV